MGGENLTDEERYLLSSPVNADRLRRSLEATRRGEYVGLGALLVALSRDVPLTDGEIAIMDELRQPPD